VKWITSVVVLPRGTPLAPGVKFSIPETPGVKAGGRGWLAFLPLTENFTISKKLTN